MSEIRKLIQNAPEKPLLVKRVYDGIIIEPLNGDSWESGYRDLNVYGLIKNENGVILEKIGRNDTIKINSFFKKLKGFEISIDFPLHESSIRIYCKNYLIEAIEGEFRFVKDKRR